IEMLIVFAVFAVIGTLSARIISQVLDNQVVLTARGERLAELQRALQIIQRDLLQMTRRSVRDELGGRMPEVMIDADGMVELTRMGWRNPLRSRRSELQRVGYRLLGDELQRIYWDVLDRAPDSVPRQQRLLSGVERVEFIAIDRTGEEYAFWPESSGVENPSPERQLGAVRVRIEVNGFGQVERIWPVPGG
ncbi:MAG: type II secretion system minor pseudopilin GspJ, partial [Pseudomonadales bacterium]